MELNAQRGQWMAVCVKYCSVHNTLNCSVLPAGVDGAHGGRREVRVVLDGHRLLHVVLADVLIHLLHRQRLPVLVRAAIKPLEWSRIFHPRVKGVCWIYYKILHQYCFFSELKGCNYVTSFESFLITVWRPFYIVYGNTEVKPAFFSRPHSPTLSFARYAKRPPALLSRDEGIDRFTVWSFLCTCREWSAFIARTGNC